ncbi:hypothetical protein [Cupriavidus alkaliphilus]|uniref:Uncharacterized protein n=1 Tax=Cupriavidus alkaliphilus TaxID=942866 RepID=A0A7W4U179_9BURK|nr:hypothetical protein [Cupriavidus alkaliphilus]MBB2915778.1 hypothetical protein [Cupriavidus alkaliphilus]MBB3005532.1 hypothetical protein [Cupriavidus alkaliphilus]MBB3012505.1 hypothetical protein [Cupriavidus alkaliphilus]
MDLVSGGKEKVTRQRAGCAGMKTAQNAPIAPHERMASAAATTWVGKLAGHATPTSGHRRHERLLLPKPL